MKGLSKNLEHLTPSATIAISQLAQQKRAAGEDVIDLSAGEPDFETPRIASEAGIRAIQQGKTHYPPNAGLLDLRASAARHFSLLSGGRAVNADCLVVSTGAKQSLFNACFTLFGPGDKVIIPSPYWVSYPHMVRFARAEPVFVPGAVEWSLKIGVEDLEKVKDIRTKGLILCSPTNPTGAVYTRAELTAIVRWAAAHDVWVIADEIYRRIHYGPGPAPSVLDLPDELLASVVMVSGVSKAYAMTGWRIGLALAPPAVAKAMAGMQSHITSGASQPSQWAATAALSDERIEVDVARMVEEFRQRRDLVESQFRHHLPGVEFVDPVGAFYFFFRIDHLFNEDLNSAKQFCDLLLSKEGVALVPGEAFGDKRWVRLSYAAAAKEISRALERMTRFMTGG
ncbi:MAG TPA: pyridoxal phosphate-dependent aminotransferase [Gemmatimonadales bacterium]